MIARDGRILCTGYNSAPPGEPHCDDVGCFMEHDHCIRTIHAEAATIAFAAKHGIKLDGATLYVSGWHSGSCKVCTKLVFAAGIKDIQWQ